MWYGYAKDYVKIQNYSFNSYYVMLTSIYDR